MSEKKKKKKKKIKFIFIPYFDESWIIRKNLKDYMELI